MLSLKKAGKTLKGGTRLPPMRRILFAGFRRFPIQMSADGFLIGTHHLSRRLKVLGHEARLMPARYVRPYSKGQKNDFWDVQLPGHNT